MDTLGRLNQFRAVNPVLVNLKTDMIGTYHSIDFAMYGHCYRAEPQYRFNRHCKLLSMRMRLTCADCSTQPIVCVAIRVAQVRL